MINAEISPDFLGSLPEPGEMSGERRAKGNKGSLCLVIDSFFFMSKHHLGLAKRMKQKLLMFR